MPLEENWTVPVGVPEVEVTVEVKMTVCAVVMVEGFAVSEVDVGVRAACAAADVSSVLTSTEPQPVTRSKPVTAGYWVALPLLPEVIS